MKEISTMTNREYSHKDIAVECLGIIIGIITILVICLMNLKDNVAIKIIGDEYGYWAAGSWIAGYNWSEMTGITGYYGYGIGFIYAIILRLTTNQVIAYKISIVLNACFICVMYIWGYLIIKSLDDENKIPIHFRCLFALVSNLYVSNILYSQQSVCENFLTFIIWSIVFCFVGYIKKPNCVKEIVIVFLSVFSIAVHLRSIGSCFIVVLCVALIKYKREKKIRGILGILVLAGCLMALVLKIKGMYQASMVVNNLSFDGNDFSGLSWRIWFFSTKEGMIDFMLGLMGKLFYAILSTYGIVCVPFIICAKGIFKKSNSTLDVVSIVATAMFLVEILIDNFFISTGTRFDGYMYCRYYSQIVPIMVELGFIEVFFLQKYVLKYAFYIAFILLVLAKFVETHVNYSFPKNAVYGSNPFVYKYLNEHGYSTGSILRFCILVLCVYVMAILIIKMKQSLLWQRTIIFGVILLIAFSWIRKADYAFEKGMAYGKDEAEQEVAIANYIKGQGIQDKLVFYAVSFPSADPLQFLLKDSTIHVAVNKEEVLYYLQNGYYLLTPTREKIELAQEDNYELLYHSSWLDLWGM